ncbi:hypothetical Protein psc1_01790 [Candidatus Phytoplasma solani]
MIVCFGDNVKKNTNNIIYFIKKNVFLNTETNQLKRGIKGLMMN